MPLRDHFRPPMTNISSWEGFHGGWPMNIVRWLNKGLPAGYVAEPRVHHGAQVEIDVATFDRDDTGLTSPTESGGTATALWAPERPSLTLETDIFDTDDYEVLVRNSRDGRRLVATIEIVSPANKDRPEHRQAFVTKCFALLQARVSVTIIDLVTIRQMNLYRDLLTSIGHPITDEAPELYAPACRTISPANRSSRLETWERRLEIGQPLPTLPLWLDEDLAVPLELETTYEETCSDLLIP